MACQVNCPLAIRQDRFNTNPVPVFDLEIVDCAAGGLWALLAVIGQGYRHTLMVGVNPFDPDVAERSRGGESTGILDDRSECCLLGFELIDRGTLDRAKYCNLGAGGRHKQRIPALKERAAVPNTMKQEVVEIDLFNQLLATIVEQHAQRSNRCRTTGSVERTQGSCKCADIVPARLLHVADYVDAHRTQARDGNRNLRITELLLEFTADQALRLLESQARKLDRSRFRKKDAAVTVDGTSNSLE